MKKNKILLLLLLLGLILASCGSSNSSYDKHAPSNTYEEVAQTPAESAPESMRTEGIDSTEDLNIPSDRKIIVTYSMTMETKEYDESMKELNALINSFNGVRTYIQEDNYNTRNINLAVSIPRDKATEFVDEIGKIETLVIKDKNLSSEDVTDKYTDTELRLKTLREKLERLNNLQAEQSELEDLLKLENEITDTILEIERIEGSLKSMDSKIDYTRINITLREISSVVSTYTRPAFGNRLSTAFAESIDNFIYGFQELIIGIIYAAPSLLLFAIFIAIAFFVGRLIYRKFFKNKMPKSPVQPKGRREYGIKTENDDKSE